MLSLIGLLSVIACEYHRPCLDGEFKRRDLIETDCRQVTIPRCAWKSYEGGDQCDTMGEGYCTNGATADYFFDDTSGEGQVTYTFPSDQDDHGREGPSSGCRATYRVVIE